MNIRLPTSFYDLAAHHAELLQNQLREVETIKQLKEINLVITDEISKDFDVKRRQEAKMLLLAIWSNLQLNDIETKMDYLIKKECDCSDS